MPEPGIKQVIERHRASLLAIPGVSGVAAGRTKAGDACVVVYGTPEDPPAGLPGALDGYPVEFRHSGEFRAR